MIHQDDVELKEAGAGQELRSKEIPEITAEEDAPFPINLSGGGGGDDGRSRIDGNLGQTDSLDKEITRFRYRTGRQVLFAAMALMCVSVGTDLIASALGLESNLISSAFEAFKLITMTVLGYIFGSSGGKSN